jgi:hypothetical protein
MSGTETIIPEALQHLASDLQSSVPPILAAAKQAFTAGDVDGDAFSTVGIELAIAFPGSREFMISESEKKSDQLTELVDKLNSTASLWSTAEGQNTISLPGCE